MSKAAVDRQFLSQSTTGCVVGTTYTQTFTVPEGYKRLTGVLFDPDQDVSVTLYAQKAQTNILFNFSTKIGTAMGYIDPNYLQAENDILQITFTPNVLTSTPRRLTFTLQFE